MSKFRCFLYLWRLSLGEVFVFQDHPGWMAARRVRTGMRGPQKDPQAACLSGAMYGKGVWGRFRTF